MCTSHLRPVLDAHGSRRSRYPIGALLIQAWRVSGLSLGRFVTGLGYRNTAGGCRAFDAWLTDGGGPERVLLGLLRSPRSPSPEAVHSALEQTALQCAAEREDAAREAFRPLIQAVPERRVPTAITVGVLTGGTRQFTRPLPEDVHLWSEADQDAAVATFAADCSARHRSAVTLFGRITGYLLFTRFGARPWLYSVAGRRLAQVDATPPGDARLSIGGRILPAGILIPRAPDAPS